MTWAKAGVRVGIISASLVLIIPVYKHFAKTEDVTAAIKLAHQETEEVREQTVLVASLVSLYECERLQREIWSLENEYRQAGLPLWAIQRIQELKSTMLRLRCSRGN